MTSLPHTCHALGCNRTCRRAHLMCRDCWAQIPGDLKSEVNRTVGERGTSVDASWAPWWRAQARAIHHLAAEQEPGPRAEKYLARDLAFADTLERRQQERPGEG